MNQECEIVVRCCKAGHHCQDPDHKHLRYHHHQCLPVRSSIFQDSCLFCSSLLYILVVHQGICLDLYRDHKSVHFQPIQFCKHIDIYRWTLLDNTRYYHISYHLDTLLDFVLVYMLVVFRQRSSLAYTMSYM